MKILIASASVGAGHDRAAEALDLTCREHFAERAQSKWFDSVAFTNRLSQALYSDAYNFMANRAQGIWSMIYRLMYKSRDTTVHRLMKSGETKTFRKLVDYVEGESPDILICTHFMPANVYLGLGRRRIPVYVVVTDYDCHAFWINVRATGYFAGNNYVRHVLVAEGFAESRVRVTGIPIHPNFTRERDADAIRKELGIHKGPPTVLVMSGGLGLQSIRTALERLVKIRDDVQFMVVCGKNEKLRRDLDRLVDGNGRFRIFGFMKTIHDMMQVSDLIITKAGGQTVTEALTRGLPMLVFMPTPGQEVRNTVYLMEQGAALLAVSPRDLEAKVRTFLREPRVMQQMARRSRAIARPDAAREIIRLALENHERDLEEVQSRR
jgi:processive 1,2-diacylglycerol beta-glucosyltransferase